MRDHQELLAFVLAVAFSFGCGGSRVRLGEGLYANGEVLDRGDRNGDQACISHSDCPQGQLCKSGVCTVGDPCGDSPHGSTEPCETGKGSAGQKQCMDGKWSPCLPPFCENIGEKVECVTPCGTIGFKTCQMNMQWSECIVPETCNGFDDDCDGMIDEGNPEGGAACDGVCGEGVVECKEGKLTCTEPQAIEDEKCDGLDNDCNDVVDEGCDDDEDGFCDAEMVLAGVPSVCPSGGGDCDDENPEINPDAPEKQNGVDDDCDGLVDEEVVCCLYDPDPDKTETTTCGSNVGECRKGLSLCQENCSWSACGGPEYVAAAPEVCDGADNDCDGKTDEGFEPLPDQFEPNDSCTDSIDLGPIYEYAPPVAVEGNLHYVPEGDVDWFKITPSYDAASPPNKCIPGTEDYCAVLVITLELPDTADAELCVFGEDCVGSLYKKCDENEVGGEFPQVVPGQKTGPYGWSDLTFYISIRGSAADNKSCAPYDLIVEYMGECPKDGLCSWEE